MANTNQKKQNASSKKKVTETEDIVVNNDISVDTTVEQKTEAPKKKAAPKKKKVSLSDFVDVQSCVVGRLIWKSRKTGYKMIWDEYGDINPMQVSDLIDMRNDSKSFFASNWVAILGDNAEDVLDYLQVSKFYKDIKKPADLDEIICGDPDELSAFLNSANLNTKNTVVYRSKQLYDEGVIDSAKTISAIRKSTGVDITL